MTVYYLITFLAACAICGKVLAEIGILIDERRKTRRDEAIRKNLQ